MGVLLHKMAIVCKRRAMTVLSEITAFILISLLAWQYDIWRFTSKPFNGTKVLVSGWNMITQYQPPIDTSFLFPAAGSIGSFNILRYKIIYR